MTEFPLSGSDRATMALLRGRARGAPFLRPASPDTITPHRASLECGLIVILTIDKGHWFPNADWQNCLHLSLSQPGSREPDPERERAIIDAVFPEQHHQKLCLEHRPGSPVRHWRLFFTDAGEFVVPKGEMYTRSGSDNYFRERERAKAAQSGEEAVR